MAAANRVNLSRDIVPVLHRPGVSAESTEKASSLLQTNHDQYHIFFNKSGFHNHIAHHLLTIWALRASPNSIQTAYDNNQSYQRPQAAPKDSIVENLHDPEFFAKYLGPESHYSAFLAFFQREIATLGWQDVLQKYVFAGDERADDMLVRMFAGFLHPLIHLGFGVEFAQPAIMAEALAQAACHDRYIGDLLLPAEQQAAKLGNEREGKSIVQLLDEIHADRPLSEAAEWSDGNKIRDGILKRAGGRMVSYAAQVHVQPADLARKSAEMTNAAAYYTGGAQRSDRAVKYDFYFMHCVNSSVFFPAFLQQDWLSEANKVRLLEWKIRLDLIMYASRRSPDIRLQDIKGYKPVKPSGWDEIEDRACLLEDDGHGSKLVRALANGQRVSEPYEDLDAFRLKRDDWLQLAHMAIDSVEAPGENWIRSAGFDEAWKDVPLRAQL